MDSTSGPSIGERKRPFFIRARSRGPIAFAGLWETWEGPNGEEVETVAIITTPANRMLGAIAERMPAILPPDAFDLWLDCAAVDAETAAAFIVPAPEACSKPTRSPPRSTAPPTTAPS